MTFGTMVVGRARRDERLPPGTRQYYALAEREHVVSWTVTGGDYRCSSPIW